MHFEADIAQEFHLCAQFLTLDERNFHCWNYRRWVADTFVRDEAERVQQELEFSTEKINQNFSNYSAFHHRSFYIQRSPQDPEQLLRQEFEMVMNALYTEPDDQSAWWYYSFLVSWATKHAEQAAQAAWFSALVHEQIEALQSLLEVEEGSKWPRVTLANLLELKARAAQDPQVVAEAGDRQRTLLHDLCSIDPAHHQRYKYLLANSAV
jgi:geranylgeranyl transferase type-2 subunit alpha